MLSHHTAQPLGWALLISGQDMDTETIEEVDEAIFHAYLTRSQTIDSKKHIIDKLIDDLLDSRLELMQC